MQQHLGRPIKIRALVADEIKAEFKSFDWDEAAPDAVMVGMLGRVNSLELIGEMNLGK